MMTPARSLWVKLSVAFLLVVAVAVGTVAVLTNRATTRQFEIYVSQGRQQRAGRLAPDFAAYYARTGSWVGVQEWAGDLSLAVIEEDERRPGGGKGLGRGPGQGSTASADRIVLVDTDGLVIADSAGDLVGQHVNDEDLSLGAPIAVEGELVGTLIIPAEPSVHLTAETEFLRQANRTLLWAGLIAGAVALAMGLFLARQLTAPLRALTRATQHLADADLSSSPQGKVPQVEVQTQDEIGQLGQAFNHMATSLAQQRASRRNMMADIAHELRTPLTVIRGDLEALLDGVYEPTPEALASIQEEALMLSRLVEDLRALAEAEAGQLRLERRPTDLAELLGSVVVSFDLLAETHGQTLSLQIAESLPLVDIDPLRVRQVAANLVSNALRHAASQGGHVIVSAAAHPGEVEISVADDGPGIADEELPYLFDRFWRGNRARHDGSGLGLAIARELVRAHGGRIWVESPPGRGTTFAFTLPRTPEPA
jgi:two-component system OmpR family sensor kinase/two-component system sensor histidine kinase BaeS